jgi:hypothetical protein
MIRHDISVAVDANFFTGILCLTAELKAVSGSDSPEMSDTFSGAGIFFLKSIRNKVFQRIFAVNFSAPQRKQGYEKIAKAIFEQGQEMRPG